MWWIFGGVALGLIGTGVVMEVRRRAALGAFVAWARRLHALHPRRNLAYLESAAWIIALLFLVNFLTDLQDSLASQLIWYLTIGVHEIGHLICMPFGPLVMFLGGSIWQVLFWFGLGAFGLVFYRRVGQAALFWTVAGYSLLDVSVYIRDAQERDLDLLPGFTEENHDWWNILRMTGLLPYDDAIANVVVVIGVFFTLGSIALGLLTTWALPRTGEKPRYKGGLWAALRRTWT